MTNNHVDADRMVRLRFTVDLPVEYLKVWLMMIRHLESGDSHKITTSVTCNAPPGLTDTVESILAEMDPPFLAAARTYKRSAGSDR